MLQGLRKQRDGKVNAAALLKDLKEQQDKGVPEGLAQSQHIQQSSDIHEGVKIMA